MKPLRTALAVALMSTTSFAGGGHDHPHPAPGSKTRSKEAPGTLKAGAFRFRVEFDDQGLRVFPSRRDGAAFPAKALTGKVSWRGADGTVEEHGLEPVWDGPGKLHALELQYDFSGVPDGTRTANFTFGGLDPKGTLEVSTILRRMAPEAHAPAGAGGDHPHEHGHGGHGHDHH